MQEITTASWPGILATGVGALCTALGLTILVRWHTHNTTLLQIPSSSAAMVYNTALGFFLCGMPLIAIAFLQRCLAAGRDDYLSKPVKAEVLQGKLERWTKRGELGNGSRAGGEPAPDTLESVIDQAQLTSLRSIQQPGEADFVTELIDLFVTTAASDLKALSDALTRDDQVEIRRVAHHLRGGSANIGATRLAAMSKELEKKDPGIDTSEFLELLGNEFELVRKALNAERKETEELVS